MLDSLRVVLVSPRNPLNIGAAARAMSNFGCTRLRLVHPYDVAFREARSAVRAGYILEQAEIFESVADAVADCTLVAGTTAGGRRDLHMSLHRLEAGGGLLKKHLAGGPAALLFGSEKFGLSNEDMSHCHWLMHIPTRDEHASMNLGQAVAICLYELRREEQETARRFPRPADVAAEDLERLTELLSDVLARSGYTNERVSRSSELKLRRLIRRLGMPANDAETWLGMFRQILWKLKEPRS
ncbi:MAG TPA: TrmH family RNA methyltransferase [Bryobacteraceae bacterium]